MSLTGDSVCTCPEGMTAGRLWCPVHSDYAGQRPAATEERVEMAPSPEAESLLKAYAQVLALREALEGIAHHPHNGARGVGQYGIGVQDGHRCAARIARKALGTQEPDGTT